MDSLQFLNAHIDSIFEPHCILESLFQIDIACFGSYEYHLVNITRQNINVYLKSKIKVA